MAIREKAFQKVLPARGWRALLMRASFAFMKWLIPRPRLFAWLQVPPHSQDWGFCRNTARLLSRLQQRIQSHVVDRLAIKV